MFQKELNESEHLVFQAVHGLQRALQGDYRDVVNVKDSSRQRLEALREAAIKVSTGHNSACLLLEPSFDKIITLEVSDRHIFQCSVVVLCMLPLIFSIFNHVIKKCHFNVYK